VNLTRLTWATWIRESVNGLLPVGRIGGEIVAYRILRRNVDRRADAAASLVADMALSVLSQAFFALLGLGLLLAAGGRLDHTTQLLIGLVVMIVVGALFVLVQRAGAISAATSAFDRLVGGRLRAAVPGSVRLDQAIRAIYERHRDVGA